LNKSAPAAAEGEEEMAAFPADEPPEERREDDWPPPGTVKCWLGKAKDDELLDEVGP
jgi:hypothetical protein